MDGLGTELGGSALLLIIAREIVMWIRDRRIVKELNGNAGKHFINNPENVKKVVPINGSSTNWILHVLNEHAEELKQIVDPTLCREHREQTKKVIDELDVIRRDLNQVSNSVSKIEGRLLN